MASGRTWVFKTPSSPSATGQRHHPRIAGLTGHKSACSACRPSPRSAEALVSHCIDFRAGSQETDAGSPGWLGPGGLAGWEWQAIGIANGCNWFSPFDSSRLHQDLHELLESIYLYIICDYFCWTLLIIFDNFFFPDQRHYVPYCLDEPGSPHRPKILHQVPGEEDSEDGGWRVPSEWSLERGALVREQRTNGSQRCAVNCGAVHDTDTGWYRPSEMWQVFHIMLRTCKQSKQAYLLGNEPTWSVMTRKSIAGRDTVGSQDSLQPHPALDVNPPKIQEEHRTRPRLD